MPLAARRIHRAAVIGPGPVACAVARVRTAAVVAHRVSPRADRQEDRRDQRRYRRG
jgi:hypothetical protein